MTRNIIATIRLCQGRVGFYDELSRIHLSIGAPTAHVYSGTNCARLRRAVRDGVITLIDGTLGADVPPFKVVEVNGKFKLASNAEAENKPVVIEEEAKEEVPAPVKEETAKEEAVEEKQEEVKEEVKEETPAPEAEEVEEKPKKKKTARKSKKAEE